MVKLLKAMLIMGLVALGTAVFMMSYLDSPVNRADKSRRFEISQGETARMIAGNLRDEGFIRSPMYFLLVSSQSGQNGKFRAGAYRISGAMSTRKVLEQLVGEKGLPRGYRLTIPEGFTAAEVAARAQEEGLCNARRFMDIVRNPNSNGIDTHGYRISNLEGYLFPETHFFDESATCENVAQRVVDQFFKEFGRREESRARQLGYTMQQIVTIASLVEDEAKVDSERTKVASVIYNRLRSGMLLQIDATVQYVLPARKERLLYRDLEVDSPYNTYKRRGLPPGPICNPGRESILAALHPERTNYYYYVARGTGDGSHYFTRTPEQHQAAVDRAKREAGR